ncbi:S-adenosylmethionine:tRNA ribosyltransferase-isomerase [Streptomyces niveus]|uniref:S-adenosylmethionine:tRNA ribosyltransferase-isomerase n=1 Tax=Streptomyces niveus TaxID=193462 RepID=UPI0033B78883
MNGRPAPGISAEPEPPASSGNRAHSRVPARSGGSSGTRSPPSGSRNATRAGCGRISAVGTTAVRALESAADPGGSCGRRPAGRTSWSRPGRGVRVVDGPLTGPHEPQASHPLMREAIAGRPALERGCTAAVRRLHLWHEVGDVHLVRPDETTHSPSCASNFR